MAAPLLAEALGGSVFLGFLVAVAFATILAVVAGLTLAGASALSHDLYVGVLRRGAANEKEEVKVAKIATVFLGTAAVILAMLFKGQNVAFMVGLAFAIAASANFPALIMSLMWKKFTTKAAVWSIYTGMSLAVILIVLSPTVWVDIIKVDQKKTAESRIKEIDAKISAVDRQIESLQKGLTLATTVAAGRSGTGTPPAVDREQLLLQKKQAAAQMPVAPIKYKNVGLFSMAAAFLVGIALSLLYPEKESEEKFADEKLRQFAGIGAE